ncbi:MAG: peptide chain release factor N(5)-glutamine methyltransferase [Bacteroidales bacterium]|nr:peptide chain release factor N(5)-glutamine methyltransferase [Bacteroidales bacterium]
MTIGQLYTHLLSELKAIYPYEEARSIVYILMEQYLQVSKAKVMMRFGFEVPDSSLPPLAKAMEELLEHKPMQYIMGKSWFLEGEFKVNQNVLIPRPETEELTNLIIEELNSLTIDSNFPLKILDIGTGSGCIAITLKNHFPEMSVFAVDLSEEALSLARINALDHKADVIFIHADILDQQTLDDLPSFDVIVSNPPYVLESEKKLMQQNVLKFEPHSALFVPDADPLRYYKAIDEFASYKLRPGGYIFLEINERFGEEVKLLYLKSGFRKVDTLKDLSSKDRFVICRS